MRSLLISIIKKFVNKVKKQCIACNNLESKSSYWGSMQFAAWCNHLFRGKCTCYVFRIEALVKLHATTQMDTARTQAPYSFGPELVFSDCAFQNSYFCQNFWHLTPIPTVPHGVRIHDWRSWDMIESSKSHVNSKL